MPEDVKTAVEAVKMVYELGLLVADKLGGKDLYIEAVHLMLTELRQVTAKRIRDKHREST